ncbi:hypothetical protein PO909_027295 [Leuciscus waleckii]
MNLRRGQERTSPQSLSPFESDQVRKPATPRIAEGGLVEFRAWEDSPVHFPTAECENELASGSYFDELKDIFEELLIDFFEEIIPSSPVSPALPVSFSSSKFLQRPLYSLNSRPGSLSHLLNQPVPQPLLRCCPSAPRHLPRAVKICQVSSGHRLHPAQRNPCLRLQPLCPSLHLGSSLPPFSGLPCPSGSASRFVLCVQRCPSSRLPLYQLEPVVILL